MRCSAPPGREIPGYFTLTDVLFLRGIRVQQLDTTDTRLIEREVLGPPQHISPILIYDPPATSLGHLHFREILDTFRRNLHKSVIFRRRLLRAPLNMDRPYWAEDDRFDLDYHVRHIALPQPGNWSQLRQLLARLHAVPLDMSRPLWEAYVIEGLNALPGHRPGSFALLLKVHHSAAGNDDIVKLISALHQTTPTSAAPPAPSPWRAAPSPTTLHMLTRAYLNGLRFPAALVQGALRRSPLRGRFAARSSTGAKHSSNEQHGSRFNAPISEERVTDLLLIPQASLRSIMAGVAPVTAYDVLVCIIGGALREYLGEKGELPAMSLALALPERGAVASASAKRAGARSGTLSLGTDIGDPIERLRVVHASSTARPAHGKSASRPAGLAERVATTSLWPAPEARRHASTDLLASLTADDPAYLASTRLSSTMAMPALADHMGLMHGALRHEETISLMFVACRTMLPDPECYLRCLHHSLHELSAAAR